ncbi:hypothetical protein PPERSA_12317 [Pseudocohnilembus persalinus]|uniref:Uncharacterized protein n=1 Tax=Pseudocohnilembus persalinus TaxID=266149 RepID=A0A0V0R916_PSEPJ|nr:hypothetical protein PPERSA_12317 [Pseudocohnilembus persalinus]|eukprot:KRX10989.1 hypothetical protein PPERSA_12317 [Pseudocohnilembus persalinus]
MEDQNKIGFFWIILGVLGLLAALAALLYLIKEVPYNGYDAHHAIFREKLEKSNQRQRFLTQSQQQFQQSQFNLQPYNQQQMAYNSQFYQPDTNQTIFLPTQQIVSYGSTFS